MSWIEYQRSILADRVRNDLFGRALASVIRKGETVVADIGSGTGFLSFLAARLGAREVLAIEHNEALLAVAEKLAKNNRIKNLTLMCCNSADIMELPPVDLVISETLGNYALEENILEILRDAKRFLAPGGILLPRTLEQYLAPVINPLFHDELASWDRVGFGLDYSLARTLSFNNLYVRRFQTTDMLGAGVRWDHVNLLGKYSSLRKGTVEFSIDRPTVINGFANWWRAELVPDMWLSTSPHDVPTHWEQIYFPIAEPIPARAGDVVTMAVTSDSRDGNGCTLKWTVKHRRGDNILSEQKYDIGKGG